MNKHIRFAEHITNILENRFRIMGMRFGLDPILGIIPGIGDILPALLSAYLVWIGIQMRIPNEAISKMVMNIVADFVIGIVPIIGDFGDFIFKSSTKNLQILKEYARDDVVDIDYRTI